MSIEWLLTLVNKSELEAVLTWPAGYILKWFIDHRLECIRYIDMTSIRRKLWHKWVLGSNEFALRTYDVNYYLFVMF